MRDCVAPITSNALVAPLAWLLLVIVPALTRAQPGPDSVRLGDLHAAAIRVDPRRAQLDLLRSRSDLQLGVLDAERLPVVTLATQAQYLSDVPVLPFSLPGGASPAPPPNDNYDLQVAARQRLYDPTRAPRRALEAAQLAEAQSRVQTVLHGLRQQVNDAFFTALALQAQEADVEASLADLDARLQQARERVLAGSALPSEPAALEAELLRRRQLRDEVRAHRDAALAVLGDLTSIPIGRDAGLVIPDLADDVARARRDGETLRARPEYEQFDRARHVLDAQQRGIGAQERPRISAFGRAGYGQPGLNPLARTFDEYWTAGVQVEWSPFKWGTTEREREALAVQRRIVATEEAAFTAAVRRSLTTELSSIGRLERSLEVDDEIIALRERILAESRLRLDEGVLTAPDYVDRETDLLSARLSRTAHRVELGRARARFLTLLGLEVR